MMKLSSLTIQAFRGIRDRLELDFSSALTVLFAPNGTGKTSVCDAVEWLLTGQIDRLGIGLRDGQEGLRCAFSSPKIKTEVQADASINQGHQRLARTEAAAWMHTKEEWKKQDERELLDLLAPGLVDENVHGMSANATRRGWLRGCRFLSGESLGLLVDSSENSIESRQRVFADILGTRPLVDTCRKITRYCHTMNKHISSARAEENVLREETEHLVEQLGVPESGGASSGMAHEIAAAVENLRELSKTLEKLEVPDVANAKPTEAIDGLMRALAQAGARLGELSATISEVEVQWPERIELGRQAKELSAKVASLSSEIVGLRTQANDAAKNLQASEEQLRQFQSEVAKMASCSAQIRHLVGVLTPLVQSVTEMRSAASSSMAELYASTPEYKLPNEELEARCSLAKQMADTWHEWSDTPEELSRLDLRQKQLVSAITKIGDTEQLQSHRDRLRSDVQKQRQQYEATTGAVNRLRQAADSALQHLTGQSRCPVCSTEFGDARALAEAIHETVASMPSAQAVLAQNLTASEAQLKELEARIQRGLTLKRELEETRRRLAAVSALKKKQDDSLILLGLSWGPDLPEGLARQTARISAARAMRDLLAAVQPLGLADSSWGSDFTAFVSVVAQRADEETARLGGQVAQRNGALEKFKAVLFKATRDGQQRAAEKSQVETQLAAAHAGEQTLKRKWESLVRQGVSWSDDAFADVKLRHTRLLEIERQAAMHLAAAKRIREIDQVTQLVQKRRLTLTALRARLQHTEGRAALANGVQELLEKRIDSHTREQIEALRSVVAPLFARMQANRVFDTVQTGESPLDWLGMAEDTAFLPDRHFSQGQRQDLALAIFLARARGLGGSFFLDEPLAHLDDLNRLALLDALRVMVVEEGSDLNLVITTANRALVKHLVQKCARVITRKEVRPLRVYELKGNPRVGVKATEVE